jgi:hypothetical protein
MKLINEKLQGPIEKRQGTPERPQKMLKEWLSVIL